MALRRNAELHSGESPFSGLTTEIWEEKFWGGVETILEMQEENLELWLGTENSRAPARIIEQAAKATEWAVKHRINRCEEDFERKYYDPTHRQKIIDESKHLQWARFDPYERTRCPACGSLGFMVGTLWDEEVIDSEPGSLFYDDDGERYIEPPIEKVIKTFSVEEFVCRVCLLHLFGREESLAGNLPDEFTRHEEREREFEPDYENE